jgi:hypothetical protein
LNYSLAQVASALGGEVSGGQVLAPGPGHSPKDRSLAVKLDPAAPDGFVVHSFAGDDPLRCRDHFRDKMGIRWEPAKRTGQDSIVRMTQRVSQTGTEYIYKLEDGTPYLRVKRTPEKQFYQAHWTGSTWANGAPKGPKIPYRLPELLQAEHDTVLIVEGEKDADNLASLGLMATTNAGGAERWTDDLAEHFKGRDVYIIPDNDEPGERHAAQVSAKLAAVAREIRVVRLPGLPPKGDVSDWLASGGTVDDLARLMDEAKPEPKEEQPSPILSSAEFLEGFVPPDYLIDGLIQRRFCYSLTAPTGHGKTAVALVLAASKALGRPIGKHDVEPGRVLYFAGENPDDVRMRWIVLSEKMGFDPKAIDVHFLPGTAIKLSEIASRIRKKVQSLGGVSFVLIDTSAAYFEGDEENGNVQAGNHARLMRGLVSLPGEPCVLVMCHPVKNATQDNLLPRGGGAFTAEVDGNLTCWKTDSLVSLHWQGKFRGPDFAPISFELETVTSPNLRDSKGRTIPSVVARALTDQERSRAEANAGGDEDALLLAIADNPRASFAGLAVALGWISSKGENKAKVKRCADRLKADRLVKPDRRGTLCLTEKGETEVKRLRSNTPAVDERFIAA